MKEFLEIAPYIFYLVASVLFIIGIKMLGSPKTARKGNMYSAIGMLIAIVVTLIDQRILTFEWIIIGIVVGSLIGAVLAIKVQMTAMPQMVGLLNGFGGGASALVAFSEYFKSDGYNDVQTSVSVVLSILIGAVTFSGSLIAFGKLQGIVTGRSVKFPMQNAVNVVLILFVLFLGVLAVIDPTTSLYYEIIVVVSLILGVLLVMPIGGADMPVVISLLNSYSGIAASMTGFVLGNNMLIIAGALVGASGIILTDIMCKGMNRSLMNVLLGGWDTAATLAADQAGQKEVTIKSVDVEEAALIFDAASKVVIIPGYGMAVAQAQHAVKELMNVLQSRGIDVKFAIHPVAGRMPGHMNVLLAEADVPYDRLYALEDINDDFSNTDVCLIIGANDVVNPAARNNPASPIYGMPILNADFAKTVIINKRSMAAGYAGIDNELFGYPNALMYFGDAKDAMTKLANELKNM
ncbi:MAG: NAD(P)(+) transhydrogenase (Re/Si-specific) subunit beta [Ignavibacteriae bacterium]|nr:NAD(P)(+) transhydrogenase (Re/Si-specific) subunit beta [Ignavibacteriota bacterium]MCB9243188.1 NAD(P)(+) transhydrogenase (Re/Si-specific) subunit beta [Ignavibacteriales bacterium]